MGRQMRWHLDGDRVYLQSAARGQEFVLDTTSYPEAVDWVASLLEAGQTTAGGQSEGQA